MPNDFPATPSVGTIVTFPSGASYRWNGGQWDIIGTTGTIASVKTQIFASSGTYTPSPGMVYCVVEAVGGGGGGGGTTNPGAGNASTGGGGGSGAYCLSTLTAAQIGTSQTVTCGAGGASGTPAGGSGNAGGNGGATSLGSLVVAPGGIGGQGSGGATAYVILGGAGGVGSSGTGQFRMNGNAGGPGIITANIGVGGQGGGSYWGGTSASPSAFNSAGNGSIGAAGGGGAGGAAHNFASGASGGAGGVGFVIITEYCTA